MKARMLKFDNFRLDLVTDIMLRPGSWCEKCETRRGAGAGRWHVARHGSSAASTRAITGHVSPLLQCARGD